MNEDTTAELQAMLRCADLIQSVVEHEMDLLDNIIPPETFMAAQVKVWIDAHAERRKRDVAEWHVDLCRKLEDSLRGETGETSEA